MNALDDELIALTSGLRGRYEEQMEHYAFQNALSEIFKVIGRANKYIDENAPWVLAKDMETNGFPPGHRHVQPAGGTARLCHSSHPLYARLLCRDSAADRRLRDLLYLGKRRPVRLPPHQRHRGPGQQPVPPH